MSKPIKTVSVCGCGWLGLPLAKHLVAKDYTVVGTKRSSLDAKALEQHGIQGVAFTLTERTSWTNTTELFGADALVVNIPPGRRTIEKDVFVANMKALIDAVKAGGTGQLILISTTSVYGELKGTITETTTPSPTTESGKAHVEIENYVFERFGDRGAVLRLSGLVGEDRHPARYLAGRSDIANGNDPVNLVHRDDCIAAICALIEKGVGGRAYHLCTAEHPTREAFYQWAAKSMGLVEPSFTPSDGSGKRIDATETLASLGLTPKYRSPYDMPLPKV
ncbi:NAD-dependent epimerase/dehydratase family protein [Enterovibrio coralii]|uniref:NAD(P)-dependent oxidoreductase n=1 Tax=Enterovibrio coralii TaxID=294935 RepID=A0A135I9T3_9GAMM|nr:NAD-dependent epimerase/dehydratase family protein [Enterovibrio coralii]KXF82202.1 NAD(P)-dependent oxidoreductase [Enterovibrio coralii]